MATFLRWGFALPAGVVALLAVLASLAGVADWSIGLMVSMACAVSADAALHIAARSRQRAMQRAQVRELARLQVHYPSLERAAAERDLAA